ncbi:MAG: DUF4365 domain-containing protein [Zoogloea sp.]|nr:DUF4365 domain-containing protein [Zoogloea sp.]
MKEAISREFLRILAHSHGFKVIEPPQDHGVDMMICPVTKRVEPSGKVRFLDSQFMLHFQLKSTTATGIVDAGDDIKFDLEVKNYNDLVYRREELLPLHLVVVVLNCEPPNCVGLNDQELSLAGKAYWYLPVEGAEPSNNQTQIRITIPKTNQLGLAFIRERFEELGVEL